MIIESNKKQVPHKSKNPRKVEEAVALGKKLLKTPEITKVSVANQMFALIHDEPREVIAKAFMDGANLTEKGAMTYYYNCRRKFRENSK